MGEFLKIPSIVAPESSILLSPLDWGLGHASRMIPLIAALTAHRCRVTVAANGLQKQLIRSVFPQLDFLSPPDYQVRYHKNRAATIASLALAIPRLRAVIAQEERWVGKVLQTHPFDLVISDNRYGLFHQSIPTIFVTHQLRPKTAFGGAADSLLQTQLYKYINRFTEIWVPDQAEPPGLAGELSHPAAMPTATVRYIGWLSRLGVLPPPTESVAELAIVSGPEPQRTIFEDLVLARWKASPGPRRVLLRGLPGEPGLPEAPAGSMIYNHLSPDAFAQQVANASLIICRSGYSSLMDLVPTGKRLLLVPTPGQSEQEYLAALHHGGRIESVLQNNFTRRVAPDG